MKKFYIITNYKKDPDHIVTREIQRYITEAGGEAILGQMKNGIYNIEEWAHELTCILTLGGDGTLIRTAGALYSWGIPILGINLGTLGYLTEIEMEHLKENISQLVKEESLVEERMMIQGKVLDHDKVAINDIVLVREGEVRTIQFEIYVNGSYLHGYKADGMILSTPTGSTGYSMSAGGPIVEPTASLFIATPICPHSLSSRSIILSSDDVIEIKLGEGREGEVDTASVSFDGNASIHIKTGDSVKITKADHTMKLMKLSSVSFLETLRKKMAGN